MRRGRDGGWVGIGLIMLMSGCVYIGVPLYKVYCESQGVKRGIKEMGKEGREMEIKMEGSKGEKIKLKGVQEKVKVRVGESALIFYEMENESEEEVEVMATYSIIPSKGAIYVSKIQCFCFEEQRVLGKLKIEMPVLFYIESDMLEDAKMEDIRSMRIKYKIYER